MLQAPTNQDLGRGPTVPRCDLRNDWMIESMTAGEGAVCFQLNLFADAESEQLRLIQEGMELDLVHGGRRRARSRSFPYNFAVSNRRYPISRAVATALRVCLPEPACHMPSPRTGIVFPSWRVTRDPRVRAIPEPTARALLQP